MLYIREEEYQGPLRRYLRLESKLYRLPILLTYISICNIVYPGTTELLHFVPLQGGEYSDIFISVYIYIYIQIHINHYLS